MNCRSALLGVVALVGCAWRTLPNSEVVRAEGTISAAAAIGAGRNPRASQHLDLAKKRMEEAKALARDGKTREALLVLQGAQADAELSLMIVRAAKAREDAQEEAETAGQLSSTVP